MRPRAFLPAAAAFLAACATLRGSAHPAPTLSTPPRPFTTVQQTPSEDALLQAFAHEGLVPFHQAGSATLLGPEGYAFSMRGFTDPTLEPWEAGDVTDPDVCRMVVLRSDGDRSQIIATFDAPLFPEGARYAGYPVECYLVNWDEPQLLRALALGANLTASEQEREAFSLAGYSSDINHNGLPEFALYAWYCPNACDGDEGALTFYEVQNPTEVVEITANLPGVLVPGSFLHSIDPLTLRVSDVTKEFAVRVPIETWWVFQWNGDAYQDVSSQFLDEYLDQIQWIEERVTLQMGRPFTIDAFAHQINPLLLIYLYEKAGQPLQGLEEYLRLTDPDVHPGTSGDALCWLQFTRALFQSDLSSGQPFSAAHAWVPPLALEHLLAAGEYDLSACESGLSGG